MSYNAPSNSTPEIQWPASNFFIACTIMAALFLNMLPWEGIWLKVRPDFVAIILLFWCMHRPSQLGIGIAWLVGVFADVADASLFGQHALSYTILAYCGAVLHRRLRMFSLTQQISQVLGIFFLVYLSYALIQWLVSQKIVWSFFLGCLSSALFWMPISILLREILRYRAEKQAS